MYQYSAIVNRWIDGDTVDLIVDLGFNIKIKERFRVVDLDTSERGEESFQEAKVLAETVMPIGSEHLVETVKKDKYGRWLVKLPALIEIMNEQGLNKLTNT